MSDLDGGVGRVDVLSAGSAGARGLDVEVFGPKLDINFLGFGENRDRDGRGMNTALGLRGGDALDTVDAGFIFEGAENFFAGDFEDDFFKAADV